MYLSYRFFKYVIVLLLVVFGLLGCSKLHSKSNQNVFTIPKIDLKPHQYVIYKTSHPLTIDGKLTEDAWQHVRWTNDFINITGDSSAPHPHQQTRAKLLWNKRYLYIGIQLKETDIWATMAHHDAPLFIQNACEIFIDPDGDTQHYLEFGINALSTTYDLLMPRPYQDGGHPIRAYNLTGLEANVSIDGTLNNPSDTDTGWTAEIALPIRALQELNMEGGQTPPKIGDQWRIQLARAERRLTVSGQKYVIKKDSATGKPLPEIYTSWAPQGLVSLHYPEMWGYAQFSAHVAGRGHDTFTWHQDEQIKWALRNIYYRQKQYYANHHTYTGNLSLLGVDQMGSSGLNFSPHIYTTPYTFLALSRGFGGQTTWFINQNGKIWHNRKQQPKTK